MVECDISSLVRFLEKDYQVEAWQTICCRSGRDFGIVAFSIIDTVVKDNMLGK